MYADVAYGWGGGGGGGGREDSLCLNTKMTDVKGVQGTLLGKLLSLRVKFNGSCVLMETPTLSPFQCFSGSHQTFQG